MHRAKIKLLSIFDEYDIADDSIAATIIINGVSIIDTRIQEIKEKINILERRYKL